MAFKYGTGIKPAAWIIESPGLVSEAVSAHHSSPAIHRNADFTAQHLDWAYSGKVRIPSRYYRSPTIPRFQFRTYLHRLQGRLSQYYVYF